MSLVPSLLQAILKVDGEALVMHAGEKPYVVAPSGQIELASRGLTLEAVDGIVRQLLPVELQRALEEFGAVQYELPAAPEFPGEHFTVVAARGGDDVWTEIRRRRVPDEDLIPEDLFPPRAGSAIAAPPTPLQTIQSIPPPVAAVYQETVVHQESVTYQGVVRVDARVNGADGARVEEAIDDDLTLPDADQLFGRRRDVVHHDAQDVEEGEEFEIDLDAPEPPMPEVARPIYTPQPVQTPPIHVVAPPPPVAAAPPVVEPPQPVAEVEILLTIPAAPPSPAAEAPRPVAQVEIPLVAAAAPPPPVAEAPQPVAQVEITLAAAAAAQPPATEAPRPVAEIEIRLPIAPALTSPVAGVPQPVAEAAAEIPQPVFAAPSAPVVEVPQPIAEAAAEIPQPVAAAPSAPVVEVPQPIAEAAAEIPQPVAAAPPAPVVEVPQPVAEAAAEIPQPVAAASSSPVVEVPQPIAEAAAETPQPVAAAPPPPVVEVLQAAGHRSAALLRKYRLLAQRFRRQPVAEVPPPVVEVPEPVAVAEVPPPVVEAPEPVAVAEVPPPVVDVPEPVAVAEVPPPVVDVPEPVAVAEVPPPVVEAPEPVAVAEVPPPVVEVPEPVSVAEVPPPVVEVPEPVAVAEVPPPVVEVPEPVSVAEVPPPVVEVPEPVAVAEVPPPVVEVPEPVAVAEVPPPVVEVPEPVAVAEVPPPVVEVPEPVAVAEVPPPVEVPEPVAVAEVPPLVVEVPEPVAVAEVPPPVVDEAPEPVAVAEVAPPVEMPEPVVVAWVPPWVGQAPEPVAVSEVQLPFAEMPQAVAVAEVPPPVAEMPEPVAVAEVQLPFAEMPEPVAVAEVPPPSVEAPEPVVVAEVPWFVEAWEKAAVAEIPPPQVVETPEPIAAAPAPKPARPMAVPPHRVVLPISRNPIRSTDVEPPPVADPTMSGLDRLLRVSAARGASTLYLSTDARPSVRVDGELQTIDGEPVLSARDVESLLLTLMPERSHEALRTGAATEWICDIETVGRVRCLSFRDHRGPGGVFRLMATRSVSVDQLGLPRSVQALMIEPEGLILVVGPRSSGKRTLLSGFVDQINRTRHDHVITIEREINIVHEPGSSFISQREVRGNDDDMLAAVRGALREDPDVLVVEDLRTAALMNVALEAAAAGRLVVAGFSAHTAASAVDRIIDLYAPEHRGQVQLALSDSLRGVIMQVLLRKAGGGRVAAREVLLNTPAVSSLIAEGKTSQLAMAIEGGRRYGMMPINDALVGLVQSGTVDAREAYRWSTDRPGLLAALQRQGVDTSFVERLA